MQKVDFVIITPLEEERAAMLAHLEGAKRLPPTDDDVRVYYSATIPVAFPDETHGRYVAIVTDLLGMGRVEAANAVGDAIRRWRPRYVLLVGIAGGLAKAGVKLGDVLVAESVADYELQKLTPQQANIRWSVHRADPRLLAASRQLVPNDWRKFIRRERPVAGEPERHLGPICTGDKVVANGLLDQYREVWNKLIGVEMEAGGVASGAFQAASAPGFLMVRGVSDLADPDKDQARTESWREYACDVAAAFVEAFIKSGPVVPAAARTPGSSDTLGQASPDASKKDGGATLKLLILSASPRDMGRLSVDEEVRDVTRSIRSGRYGAQVQVIPEVAALADDLATYLFNHSPQVVHFSGYHDKAKAGGILLMDDEGMSKEILKGPLVEVLTAAVGLRLVVLNTCYSLAAAKELVRRVDFAIGVQDVIEDRASLLFAEKLFGALANGHSMKAAFDQALATVKMQAIRFIGQPEWPPEMLPRLCSRRGVDPASVHLLGT
jgi:nucleoside phosphorylase